MGVCQEIAKGFLALSDAISTQTRKVEMKLFKSSVTSSASILGVKESYRGDGHIYMELENRHHDAGLSINLSPAQRLELAHILAPEHVLAPQPEFEVGQFWNSYNGVVYEILAVGTERVFVSYMEGMKRYGETSYPIKSFIKDYGLELQQ